MKAIYLITSASLLMIFMSCGKDDYDFTGSWSGTSLRYECADQSQNTEFLSTTDGICLPNQNGEKCIKFSLSLTADGNFTFTSESQTIFSGIMLSEAPKTDTGTYTVTENSVILNYSDPITLTLDTSERFLDWNVTTTDSGCDGIYKFSRS